MSDYIAPKFRRLQGLIAVNGYTSLVRALKFIMYQVLNHLLLFGVSALPPEVVVVTCPFHSGKIVFKGQICETPLGNVFFGKKMQSRHFPLPS